MVPLDDTTTNASMTGTQEDLDFIISHVILPPKLPHEQESSDVLEKGELALVSLVQEIAKAFSSLLPPRKARKRQAIITMFERSRHLCKYGMSQDGLESNIFGIEINGKPSTEIWERS